MNQDFNKHVFTRQIFFSFQFKGKNNKWLITIRLSHLSRKKYLLSSIATVTQKFCYMDQLQPQFKDFVELTTTAIKKRVDVAQSKKRIIPHAFQQIIREVGDRISAKQRVCHYVLHFQSNAQLS
jgi:hypothetical protein